MRLNLSRSDAALFVLVGLLFAGAGGYLLYSEYQASADANQVEATVLSSEVTANARGGSEVGSDFFPRVEYRYTYGGRTYISTNVCPGAGSGCAGTGTTRSAAQRVVDRYPNGSTTTAYVDPDDPSQAFLVAPGVSPRYLVPLGAGLFVLLVGVYGYVERE